MKYSLRFLHYIRILFLTLLLTLVAGCGNRDRSDRLDKEKGVYYLGEEDIAYDFPGEIADWTVASKEQLPPEIRFCVIENNKDICLMVIKPQTSLSDESVGNPDSPEVDAFIEQVTAQSGIENVECRTMVKRESDKPMPEGTFFRKDLCLNDSVQGVNDYTISYIGYIFNRGQQTLMAVMTTPASSLEPDAERFAENYFGGFRIP